MWINGNSLIYGWLSFLTDLIRILFKAIAAPVWVLIWKKKKDLYFLDLSNTFNVIDF